VSSVRTQIELNRRHTVRERLIASLAAFFAVTAWILAGVGLYGVLGHSVLQRRREIGIRMAIGAQPRHVVWRVLGAALCTVFVGGCAGGLLSLTIGNFAGNLLYGVQAADANRLVIPALAILAAALLASVPAILRVVRIDPVSILRSE
jgi:ABC-type antimicrobial peptide transport system permease subunit